MATERENHSATNAPTPADEPSDPGMAKARLLLEIADRLKAAGADAWEYRGILRAAFAAISSEVSPPPASFNHYNSRNDFDEDDSWAHGSTPYRPEERREKEVVVPDRWKDTRLDNRSVRIIMKVEESGGCWHKKRSWLESATDVPSHAFGPRMKLLLSMGILREDPIPYYPGRNYYTLLCPSIDQLGRCAATYEIPQPPRPPYMVDIPNRWADGRLDHPSVAILLEFEKADGRYSEGLRILAERVGMGLTSITDRLKVMLDMGIINKEVVAGQATHTYTLLRRSMDCNE